MPPNTPIPSATFLQLGGWKVILSTQIFRLVTHQTISTNSIIKGFPCHATELHVRAHTHTHVYVQHLNQLSTCFLIRDMATCIPRISTKLKQAINMTSETQQCPTLLPTEVQQRFREMCVWLLWNCKPTASVDYTLLPQNMFWGIVHLESPFRPFYPYPAFSIFHSLSSLLS